MRRPYTAAAMRDDPIHGINTTPLIDVMLVLLVMFIITIPIMHHEVPVDLPQPGPAPSELVEHRLEIARDGGVRIDGVAVDQPALARRLAVIRDDPAALLTVETDPEARYEPFAQTLATVKRARISRLAFVGHAELMPPPGRIAGE